MSRFMPGTQQLNMPSLFPIVLSLSSCPPTPPLPLFSALRADKHILLLNTLQNHSSILFSCLDTLLSHIPYVIRTTKEDANR